MSADLLEHVLVTVPCNVCDESYTVPASVVRTSQEVEHGAIESLTHTWADFCRSATTHGAVDVDVAKEAARRR